MNTKKDQKVTSAIGIRRARAQKNGLDKKSYLKRRGEIAKAATKVFNELGFRGTSMGAVAKAMGISRATLYYYVSSKEELFDELVREAIKLNVTNAEKIQASNLPAVEKLRKMIIDLMCSCETNFPLFYIFIRDDLEDVNAGRTHWSRDVGELSRRYESILMSITQDGINNGTLKAGSSARVITYGILGMICWTSRWFDPKKSKENALEIGTAFAEMVLLGIKL